jgi:hypothetical protein
MSMTAAAALARVRLAPVSPDGMPSPEEDFHPVRGLTEHLPGKHDQKRHGSKGTVGADGTKVPFAKRLGRCYELSGSYAMMHDDAVLVHGSIQGGGNPRIGHGWVEHKGEIYEPISNQMWHPIVFKAMFKSQVDAKYTSSEWKSKAVSTGHWGPWGKTSGAYNQLGGGRHEADK